MRSLTRNTLAGGAVIAATIALTSTPALAATWTVAPGGAVTGTNVGNLKAQDQETGAAAVCDKAKVTGTAKGGTGLAGDKLVTLNTVVLETVLNPGFCKGPNNLKIKVTVSGLPWNLNAQSYAAGTTTGTLTSDAAAGIAGKMEASDGCTANIGGPGATKGQLVGKHVNSSGQLTASGGNLVVKSFVDPSKCDPDLINVGDHIILQGTFQASPKQTVTSP